MSIRIPRLVKLGAALGLVYGFVEAAEVLLLSLVPGALSWQTGNTPQILWVAPLVYTVSFGFAGVALAAVERVIPRARWDVALVFLLVFLGAFLAASLQGQLVSDAASAILALGLAAESARQYARRSETVSRALMRAVRPLAILAFVSAAALFVHGRIAHSRALEGLPQSAPGAPNVLLLVMDTQRADHLSLHGYSRRTSPRLDALAAESAVFDNAYANSSWTLPTHATMFTGRMPFEHRAGMIGKPVLDARFPTIAAHLRDNGYATAGFVSNVFWCGRQTGLNRGFLRYEDYYGNFGDAMMRTAIGRRVTYDILSFFGYVEIPGRKRAEGINSDFLAWSDDVGDRPFFAFINYFDVHTPLLPPPPFAGSYSGLSVSEQRKHAVAIEDLQEDNSVPPPRALRPMIDLYDESIRYLDHQIGALVDSLERRGVLDNTILIVTSDHGESWGEHGLMFHAHSLYRELTHVPLIVRLPSRIRPGRRPEPVGLNQLPATIVQLIGGNGGEFPGASLFPESPTTGEGAHVLFQLGRRAGPRTAAPASRTSLSGFANDSWYYIEPHSEPAQLFDNVADPAQQRDLARDPALSDTLPRFRLRLREMEQGHVPRDGG